jgi:hypothetical protein
MYLPNTAPKTFSAYACRLAVKCRAVASYLACIVVNRDPETFVGVTARFCVPLPTRVLAGLHGGSILDRGRRTPAIRFIVIT